MAVAKAKIKRGLGKGLDTLIPDNELEQVKSQVININKEENNNINEKNNQSSSDKMIVRITKVEPNRKQPRKSFDEDALEELSESIKKVGVLEPLLVKTNNDNYEIIAGERRWRAAKLAGIKEVPVIVRDDLTNQEIVEIQLIENIQREDLNPIEEATAYQRLISEFNLTQDEVAEKVSKSRVAITNSIRLLKLCEEVRQMVIEGKLSSGHARALISIEDKQKQIEIAEKIFDEKLSVRQAEKLVKDLDKDVKPKEKKVLDPNLETIYRNLEEKCKAKTGTKVSIISKGDKGGKIEIDFYNNDDLEKITRMIMY